MKLKLFFLILLCHCCQAVDPNCVQCADCDPAKTPRYIRVTLSDIVSFSGDCWNWGDCSITSSSINGTYILELIEDVNFPWCRWCYTDSDPNIISTRSPGYFGDDIATGLSICVTKNRYSPDTMLIIADSTGGTELGAAVYFVAPEALIESGCVANQGIANAISDCYCSVWRYMPPWTAGLGGTAVIKELVDSNGDPLCFIDFKIFAGLAGDWLKVGSDLAADWNGDGIVDLDDLTIMLKYWSDG